MHEILKTNENKWIYDNIYIYIHIYIYIYICMNACIYVYISVYYLRAWCGLQACRRRFFSWKNNIPGFFDYVNSGNCPNYQTFNIYGFGDLSKKTRAEKSWILAVLRPPDLSRRADWWTKRWIEIWTLNKDTFLRGGKHFNFPGDNWENSFWSPEWID